MVYYMKGGLVVCQSELEDIWVELVNSVSESRRRGDI